MWFSAVITIALSFVRHALSTPVDIEDGSTTKVFLLSGDSTTATQSLDGGGWGDGFKNFTLKPPSFAINHGVDGATTASTFSSGTWDTILNQTETFVGEGMAVFVTIQFGHNDMKIANFSETFKENLRTMVADVRNAGGRPVIVSSLSRRNYFSNGTIDDVLEPWADYALGVAQETGSDSIDLWLNSLEYLEKIGEAAAERLALNANDTTHVNVDGSIVFGRMVSDLLLVNVSGVAEVTKPNHTLSEQIKLGIPSF